MKIYITKSIWLLGSTVVICCLIYPLVVWAIGQRSFRFPPCQYGYRTGR